MLAVAVMLAGRPLPVAAGTTPDAERVRQAIATLAAAKVGSGVTIDVELSDVRLARTAPAIVAAPDVGARLGQPSRFTLFAEGRRRLRLGEATATVRGVGEAVRARRPIVIGEPIAADDIEVVRMAIDGMRFAAPPAASVVIGARATRFLPVGSLIVASDFVAEPVVRAGDRLRAVVRLSAGVEVAGVAVALQSGGPRDVIAVMNPESRQTRRARVVASGEVEVIDVR